MTLEQFWQFIEQSRIAGKGEEQLNHLEKAIVCLPPREMVSFEGHSWDLLSISFRRELWAVASVLEPGCSQGSFDALRAWMILEGKDFFDRVVAQPDRIAERIPSSSVPWHVAGGRMLGLVQQNYHRITGEDMPTVPRKVPYVIKGPRWTEADLPDMFPELWRKYRS